jgi:drug/metabolite transporter (DMT)-like permease
LVVFSTVVSYVFGGLAVQRLSAPVAAGLAYVEPISACVLAWVLLGQSLGTVQILGGVVVLLGAYTAQRAAAPGFDADAGDAAATDAAVIERPIQPTEPAGRPTA